MWWRHRFRQNSIQNNIYNAKHKTNNFEIQLNFIFIYLLLLNFTFITIMASDFSLYSKNFTLTFPLYGAVFLPHDAFSTHVTEGKKNFYCADFNY